MTYDYFGAFAAQGPTAPHSPLTSYAGIPQPGFYTDAAIQKLKSKGIPASKLLLGIGFYGRGWTGVTQAAPGRHGHRRRRRARTRRASRTTRCSRTRCPATGTVAGTAYAKCGSNWWSYDTPATIGGKMTYAKQPGPRRRVLLGAHRRHHQRRADHRHEERPRLGPEGRRNTPHERGAGQRRPPAPCARNTFAGRGVTAYRDRHVPHLARRAARLPAGRRARVRELRRRR